MDVPPAEFWSDPRVIAVLGALKEHLNGPGARVRFVQLLLEDGTSRLITLPCSPGGSSMAGDRLSMKEGQSAPSLSDREKAAIAVLEKADRPLKGRSVATRAHLNFTSHFREMMAGLVAKELVIVAEGGGYWLKSRPLPSATDR